MPSLTAKDTYTGPPPNPRVGAVAEPTLGSFEDDVPIPTTQRTASSSRKAAENCYGEERRFHLTGALGSSPNRTESRCPQT